MPSAWNMFVKKIFEEGRKQQGKTYKFSQALKDASKRKAEMGVSAVNTVVNKVTSKIKNVTNKLRGSKNAKKAKCIQNCENDGKQEENKKKKRKSKKRSKKGARKRKTRKNKQM